MAEEKYREFLSEKCPNIWKMFNNEAKRRIPKGFIEFLSGQFAENGKNHLLNAEEIIQSLFSTIGEKEVTNEYRGDLSGVYTESQLSELLCEVKVAESLSKISSKKPELRPKNKDNKKCDIKITIDNCDLYAEVKRYEDNWPNSNSHKRSLAKSINGQVPNDSARPRSMDIYKKLSQVHEQFPNGTLNILFIFHRSFGSSKTYIEQALFGDRSYSQNDIQNDGLFAIQELGNVSAVSYVNVQTNGQLNVREIWKNPNALKPLNDMIMNKIRNLS